MQIVIDIDENVFTRLFDNGTEDYAIMNDDLFAIAKSIRKGTQLPEHGRLSDMDEFVKNIVKEYGVNSIHELPRNIKMFYDKFINSAPTILDATFDYKMKNYVFFRKEDTYDS